MTTGRFLVILLGGVFFGEALSMFYISRLRPLSKTEEVLLGTSFLTLILAPLLYYILLRPLHSGISAKKRVEQELKDLLLVDRFQKNLDSYNAESTMDYKLTVNVGISPVGKAS